MCCKKKKKIAPTGERTSVVQPVTSSFTDRTFPEENKIQILDPR